MEVGYLSHLAGSSSFGNSRLGELALWLECRNSLAIDPKTLNPNLKP